MTLHQEIAPTGTLRFAINVGNSVLTRYKPETGEVSGIPVELARDIAKKLNLPFELRIYHKARTVVEDATKDAWDIAFIARDPERAETMYFSEPYFLIDSNFVVHNDTPIKSNADVDQPNVTVGVGKGAAYDLYLTSHLRHAEIIRTDGTKTVMEMLLDKDVDVAAGIRPALEKQLTTNTDLRLLLDPFMRVEQAIATPAARTESARFIADYLDEAKCSCTLERLRTN